MAKHNETGQYGEDLAKNYLTDLGWQVVATNYRYGKAEVDLIAWDNKILVFAEVKTRRNQRYGYPEEAVSSKKESLMAAAAGAYMRAIDYDGELRFDIISIILEPKLEIEHFRDAFFPGLM